MLARASYAGDAWRSSGTTSPHADEQLAIVAWAVYRLCEDRELPHVRITSSPARRSGRAAPVYLTRT